MAVGGAVLGPVCGAVCRWTGLKWSWLSEQGFSHSIQARAERSVPRGCASSEKRNTITSRSATITASGVWWLLAMTRLPGTAVGSTGKVCDPGAWNETSALQTSLNCSAAKQDFISSSSPLLPRLMKFHLN